MSSRRISALAVILAALSPQVYAASLEINWQLSTSDCQSSTTPAPVTEMEIYIDSSSIPASDLTCPPSGQPVDVPPAGGSIVQVVTPEPGDNTVTVDLPAGVTYFIRARVRNSDGHWSNLSIQRETFIEFPVPGAPTITVIQL